MRVDPYSVFAAPSLYSAGVPVVFDENVCNGCNICCEVCFADIIAPNPIKGKPPYLLHPEECFHEGACVMHCPLADKGAIKYQMPLTWRVHWKRKETGELFRSGMANPPAPYTRPPVSGGQTWEGGPFQGKV